MQRRPVSLTIFGVLNILFGTLGIVFLLASGSVMARLSNVSNPFLKELYSNPTYVSWMKISVPLGAIAAVAILVAGIGLLCLQNWGRLLSIGYAIYTGILAMVSACIMLMVSVPLMGRDSKTGLFIVIGAVVGSFFQLIYPILLIIFMTRPAAIAACQLVAVQQPPILPP